MVFIWRKNYLCWSVLDLDFVNNGVAKYFFLQNMSLVWSCNFRLSQSWPNIFLNGQSRPFLFIFILFTWQIWHKYYKWSKCRWCAWVRTWGSRMVGADESSELWRHPNQTFLTIIAKFRLYITKQAGLFRKNREIFLMEATKLFCNT